MTLGVAFSPSVFWANKLDIAYLLGTCLSQVCTLSPDHSFGVVATFSEVAWVLRPVAWCILFQAVCDHFPYALSFHRCIDGISLPQRLWREVPSLSGRSSALCL